MKIKFQLKISTQNFTLNFKIFNFLSKNIKIINYQILIILS